MKKLLLLSFVLLQSCAHVPMNHPDRLTRQFVMDTACMEKTSIKTVAEFKNFLNQYNGGSYLFTCGQEKYACKAVLISSEYRYNYSCKLKLASK